MSTVKSKNKSKRDPLPEHFETLNEAAEFWDTHDSGDYEEFMKDVSCEFDLQKRTYLVPVAGELYEKVEKIARRRGLRAETLVNRWLAEKAS
ncbi:MAG TPA: CopG family antitoxin [Pyrinomonadaceae bacterium]|jgi:hypothetical protein